MHAPSLHAVARRFTRCAVLASPLLAALLLALPQTTRAQDTPDVAVGLPASTNLLYRPGGDHPQDKDRLDVYRPTAGTAPSPVLVFIHGGGLMQGDKRLYARLGKFVADAGFVAVIPNHRLSPSVSHPAHVEDIAAAFAWIHANIADYGGDPERIVVTGHSSGAYLAALLVTDPRYLAAHDLTQAAVRGVVPISGFFHVERLASRRPLTVWGGDSERWPEASPASYLGPEVPPMLLLYADGDTPARRQESRDMASELSDAGQPAVETREVRDRDHRSIITRFGEPDDMTAARVLDFARRVTRDD